MIGKRRRLIVSLSVTAAAVTVSLGLLFLILGLTVFKPTDPITTVDSISLADLDFSVDVFKLRVYLNVSLVTNVTVMNPNRVGFKYSNSNAYLRYRGNDVGEVSIPAGKIGGRSTRNLSIGLALMADRLISDSDFYSDVISGRLEFQTQIRLSGKVRLLFDIHVVAYATCDLEIHLISRTLVNQICVYKTKILQ
ncbi:hypothetical protein ACJIZ3_013051 [Penstemon smallii]|uniref:Late embryogenesis abundant protein LEA-2 subgroup domain-containing protein n=1 Tax=Penstemon smallii TaxID=265156 RepID=A0ABD3UNS5_9LAMI